MEQLNNKDWLDRKIDGGIRALSLLFGMVTKDAKNTIITFLIAYSIFITYKYINQNDKFSERIVQEVEKRVDAKVQAEVIPEMKKETKKSFNDLKDTITSTTDEIKQIITNTRKTK